MYEVEVKVAAAHDRVGSALDGIDAKPLGAVRQVDTYYDAPDRDFAVTDEALRIRRETPDDGQQTAYVTYKGPLVEAESKTRQEAETAVANPDATAEILEGLGFTPAATVAKDRERFAVDSYVVTLDAVDGLGEFVEVETETTDDVDSARDGAYDVLERLGLDPTDQLRTSYLGLIHAESDDVA